MIINLFSLLMLARFDSNPRDMGGRILITVFILLPLCFLLTACSTFRSADCDTIQKAERKSFVAGVQVVSGMVGKEQSIRGMGWSMREQSSQGVYSIQFDPPFSAGPRCCLESQQSSFSKLSVEVVPSPSGLHLEATHRSERCLERKKKVVYGYVVDEGCAEWQTFQVPWDGLLKFTCVSQ